MYADSQLTKRIKSFLWRLAVAVAIFTIDYIAANLGIFDLPPAVVGVISLMLGEVTKFLNTKTA